jgi:aspartyl-tRNA(Asn)/glutamyl-tRNA(Gln) amidotransferase subunit C
MAEFDESELEKLAKLCRIECTEEEKRSLYAQISEVLVYVQQLNAVKTDGVEPCYRVLETLTCALREDRPEEGLLPREKFLGNAPSHTGGMVRVPPIIKFNNP